MLSYTISFKNTLLLLFLIILFSFGTSLPSAWKEDGDNVVSYEEDKCVLTNAPPDPSSECCGVQAKSKRKRNIGGEETLLTEYPWMALLEYPSKLDILCAGFLISGRHVVTAAHCISEFKIEPIRVRLGEYDRVVAGPDCMIVKEGKKVCNNGTTSIAIQSITIHPQYNRTDSWNNDIAIIELNETAPYTDFIRPICLPSSDVTTNRSNLTFHFAGWGSFSQVYSSIRNVYKFVYFREKLKVLLPYIQNPDCQITYDKNVETKVTVKNTTICAGGEYLKGPCVGDSGGPLMYENKNGFFEAIGVFSFGSLGPCGKKDVPAIFTKLTSYEKWIRSVIKA